MITNFNDTAVSTGSDFIDLKKFIGVGTIKILAINPSNSILKQYGWNIPDGSDEPSYVSTDKDGKKNARVRFLVQVQELDEKPIIAMDFWIRPEFRTSTASGELKVQVIDNYGRTAYVTKNQFDNHEIPLTRNGNPIKIDKKYRMAHTGEADLIQFLMTFLNVTPFEIFDSVSKKYVPSKAPGELTIDHWDKLCNGDVKEIKDMVNLKPENQMKVDFGIRSNQDNKSYQAFLTSDFFANNIYLDPKTNKYNKVQGAIDRFMEYHAANSTITLQFDASPIHEWTVSATEVNDNSEADAPPSIFPLNNEQKVDYSNPAFTTEDKSDLPF